MEVVAEDGGTARRSPDDREAVARLRSAAAHADPEQRADALDLLAARAARGSPAALDALLAAVDQHGLARPAVRRLIVAEADADDVMQDVLIRVAESIGGFRGEARFTTWLHRVARNTAVDHLRRRRDTVPLDPDTMGPVQRISSVIANRATIHDVLAQLPLHYREPVVLRDLGQLPYAEIAERLRLPLNTVKTRIARGRALVAADLASGPGG